jgi:polyisoprenyl-teichoic acid--peptidoglycan teichoic acid transferase
VLLAVAAAIMAGRWLLSPVHGEALALNRDPKEIAERAARPRLFGPVPLPPASASASAAPKPALPSASAAHRPEKTAPAARAAWTNTLLVGLDRRPDQKGTGLADTIVIAMLDAANGRAALVSVPRDLWVAIPDHGEDRINVVPNVAQRSKRDPIALLSRVIEDTLGLPVNHGIVIDLGVFERSVDAVGGVEVAVPCPIIDSFHDQRVPGGRRKLELTAGRAELDGPTAAMYVRSRHGRSDFGRSRRQQAVLLGLRERVLSTDGITRLPELFSAVEASIHTDLRRYELFGLARRVLALDRGRLHGLVLAPPLTVAHATDDGKAVLLPDRDAIAEALQALPNAPAPGEPPKGVCPPADAALRGR